jgi:hypothetical protein
MLTVEPARTVDFFPRNVNSISPSISVNISSKSLEAPAEKDEVRKEADYFDDIHDEKIPKDMLDLASHIVKTKAGHFDPSKFEDQYEEALNELLKKKQEGKPIERPERPKPTNVEVAE